MSLDYRRAILRRFPQSYAALYAPRGIAIDLELAARQHEEYARALREAGLEVSVMPPDEAYPDSVFVEDTAVLWGSHALIGRPRFAPRTGEEQGIAALLDKTHELAWLPAGATLEGGDVFGTEEATYVGLSERTNAAGIEALRAFMARLGRKAIAVPVERCFHLKSAVTYLGGRTLALNPELISPDFFEGYDILEIAPANVIRLGQHILMLDGYPQAQQKLETFARAHGLMVRLVGLSEFEKGDGSITCLSLLWG